MKEYKKIKHIRWLRMSGLWETMAIYYRKEERPYYFPDIND